MGITDLRRLLPSLFMAGALAACSSADDGPADASTPPSEAAGESAEAGDHPDESEHGAGGHHVDYDHPDEWGGECSTGRAQSPIDIADARPVDDATLPDIEFDYHPADLSIWDTGHSVRIDLPETSTITLRDEDGDNEPDVYALVQAHLHAPSEHRVDGTAFELEVHLVHQEVGVEKPRLAVVGVLVESSDDDIDNEGYAPLVRNMPDEVTEEAVPVQGETVDPSALLPEDRTYVRYGGSLTTPDCDEGVSWQVLTTPVQMSPAQIAAFTDAYDDNARPVQDINDRPVQDSED